MVSAIYEVEKPLLVSGEFTPLPQVTLRASQICSVFDEIIHLRDASDPLDTLIAIQRTEPRKPDSLTSFITNLSVASTTGFLTGSALPAFAYGGYWTTKYLQNSRRYLKHGQTVWSDSAEPLIEKGKDLSGALGGLSCILWKDKATSSFVVEIGESGKEDTEAVMERLRFLEASLKANNMQNLLGGFIIPEANADGIKQHAEETSTGEIQSLLHARSVGVAKKDGNVFVKSVLVDHVDSSDIDSLKALVELLKQHDPHHAVVRQLAQDADTTSTSELRLLAKHSLEERLSDIVAQRDSDTGALTGGKQRTHAYVSENLVMTYSSDGRPTIITPSSLTFDEHKASGGASKDSVLASLEYEIFKGATSRTISLPKEIKVAQLQSHWDIGIIRNNSVRVSVTEGADGVSTWKQRIATVEKQQRPDRYRRLLGMIACVGISLHAADIRLELNSSSSFATPVFDQEVAVADGLTSFFDVADRSFEYLLTEPTKADSLRDLVQDAYRTPEGNGIIDGSLNGKNRPQWYISSERGVSVDGYWGVTRYDTLAQDKQGDFVWQHQDVVERIKKYTGINFVDSSEPLNTIELVGDKAPSGSNITVQASIVIDEAHIYMDDEGIRWQAINVPILNNHSVIAGKLEINSIYGDSVIADHGISISKVWQYDGAGATIFMQIPDGFKLPSYDDPSSYVAISYTLAPSAGSIFKNNIDEGVQFAQDSGQSIILEQKDTYIQVFTEQTSYDIEPINGKDTNNDGLYNLVDLADETIREAKANCFTANSLAVALSDIPLAPVSGYLLGADEVIQDLQQTGGAFTVLASRDSHLYTVDERGNIVDATPGNASQRDKKFLEHPEISTDKGNASPSIVINAGDVQKLKENKREEKDLALSIQITKGAIGLFVVGFGASGLLSKLRRRKDRRLFLENDKNLRAGALAMLAIYKLQGNVRQVPITKEDLARATSVPKKSDISVIKPKDAKKILKEDRRRAKHRYTYSISDIERAKRMIQVSRRSSQRVK